MRNENLLTKIAFIFAVISTALIGICAAIYLISSLVGVGMVGAVGNASGAPDANAAVGIIGGVSVATSIVFLLPLAWSIPMTIRIKKILNGEAENTLLFSILSIFFLNVISGVLLIVDYCQNN